MIKCRLPLNICVYCDNIHWSTLDECQMFLHASVTSYNMILWQYWYLFDKISRFKDCALIRLVIKDNITITGSFWYILNSVWQARRINFSQADYSIGNESLKFKPWPSIGECFECVISSLNFALTCTYIYILDNYFHKSPNANDYIDT